MRIYNGQTIYETGDLVWIGWITFDKDSQTFSTQVREVTILPQGDHPRVTGCVRTDDPVENAIFQAEWVAKGSPVGRLQHFTHQHLTSWIRSTSEEAQTRIDARLEEFLSSRV